MQRISKGALNSSHWDIVLNPWNLFLKNDFLSLESSRRQYHLFIFFFFFLIQYFLEKSRNFKGSKWFLLFKYSKFSQYYSFDFQWKLNWNFFWYYLKPVLISMANTIVLNDINWSLHYALIINDLKINGIYTFGEGFSLETNVIRSETMIKLKVHHESEIKFRTLSSGSK